MTLRSHSKIEDKQRKERYMNGKCNRAAVSALTVFAALSTAFAATWPGFECGMGIVARASLLIPKH